MFPSRMPQTDARRQSGPHTAQPRVVAIGGGTGLPNVLRGLRPLLYGAEPQPELAPRDRLVAIVATSDDGGSSGKLRAQFNMVPPGDIRNCLAALSNNHALIADLFQYRFGGGDGLNGHALGNLVLTALADVMNDFPRAVEIAARVVGACGTVLPATSEVVTLIAEFEDGRVLSGETAIASAGGRIARVALLPERPRFVPETCEVLQRASVIVAGPGSLYTSVLPPLLVPQVGEAVRRSSAVRVLVANLMTEPGETDGMAALDHLLAIERQAGAGLIDAVAAASGRPPEASLAAYAEQGARPVGVDRAAIEARGVRVIERSLVAEGDLIRHDPEALRELAVELLGSGLG